MARCGNVRILSRVPSSRIQFFGFWCSLLLLVGLLASCATSSNAQLPDGGGGGLGATTDGGSDASPANVCAQEPCFPGVVCQIQGDGFSCGDCPTGFTGNGINCSDLDGCADSPCYAGVTCSDTPAPGTGASCGDCPAGLFGNGRVCTNINGCDGSPCFAGVTCVDNPPPADGFTCGSCPTGFEGDGLSCTDIDGCANAPCYSGVVCTDAVAPLTGFSCGACPTGMAGDGATCALLCEPAATIACGGRVSGTTTGVGSANKVDSWQCSSVSHTGREIVYTFIPDGTGIVTARLSGLSADLDLLVIQDTSAGGLCDPTDSTVCIPNGLSHNSGTTSEEVRWDATIGSTYYLVVDGASGATSGFTLEVLSATEDFLLNEISYGPDDFIELRNHGACTADFGGLTVLHKASLDSTANSFTFAASSLVTPGSVLRLVESGSGPYLSNEVNAGFSIYDLPAGAGSTALCNGTCDTTTCSNLLDYVERDDNTSDASLPGGPACASLVGGPINAASQSGAVSLRRTAFAGTGTIFQASDWSFGATTRN